MAGARKAVAIAAQVLSWGGYALGMLLLYAVSGGPYAWVDGTDPQLSSANFQDSGNGRLVGLCVLAALLLLQGGARAAEPPPQRAPVLSGGDGDRLPGLVLLELSAGSRSRVCATDAGTRTPRGACRER
ncbi:hypothetical protein ACM9XD_14355 [Xanthomonas sacchari]|uniref:hypothetical protein n=1 Tax=Xanthomonas sacchari TaxID=56458 RepID=UPI00225E6745|nr:hypothetical protein [Xanthomonas sacchari]MCW0425942.1 hypothetical protein [Xanthomonas sacchari]